ncbi:MAG: tetratricopeptide repeat protein [Saprospiraceae bacterium]|nr:tetratricopeptide repeat protein [Saprospiraceae bacterium]
MKHVNKAYLLLAIIGLSVACTTQKRRDDLSPLGKLYHNTTAKYNGYFNANEIMIATFAQLDSQYQDNYNQILSMYPYLENENPQGIYPQMDTAIKKVSVVVNLHRPSQWTDDCYLLVGQAQFLKQDYESAEATFKYMLNEFDPKVAKKPSAKDRSKNTAKSVAEKKADLKEAQKERELTAKEKKREQNRLRKEREKRAKEIKKERARYSKAVKRARKKGLPPPKRPGASTQNTETKPEEQPAEKTPPPNSEGEKKDSKKNKKDKKDEKPEEPTEEAGPENYFLKHRPVYQDAKLWLAKTFIERDNYDGAQRLITQLNDDPNTLDIIRQDLMALQAYLLLKQNQDELAISPLEQAVASADKRTDKARYAFILAQLQQQAGNSDAAYANFEKVLKLTNDYEMEFNAKMNMAQNAWASGRGSAEDAVANLNQMIKDEKNTEYKDQIYYALANIALKAGDRTTAIENLILSLENSKNNNSQKLESSLKLAQLYYEDEDFVPAKQYFDIALQAMPDTDKRFKEVERLSKNLTDIAKNLEIIALQDSLLRIAQMSEDEKKEFAAKLKKQLEEQRAAEQAQLVNEQVGNKQVADSRSISTPALQKESSFFAYNDRALKQGKRDFQRKWGNRPLSDNWRRSTQQSASSLDEGAASDTVATVASVSDEEIENFLKGVPKTEAELTIVHIKIREAMMALGRLYRDRLQNNEKSIEILEELNRRYPASNEELDSWYYLYLAHKDLTQNAEAKTYADKIVAKYPNSTYAKVIQDPSYIVEVQNEENKIIKYYNDAYAAFARGEYQYAFSQSNAAREKFGATNPLQPKFALLSAMSTGNLKGKDAYVSALNEVIAKYPNTEEQKYAREVLRLLGASTGTLPGQQKIETDQFEVQNDQVHSVIVVLEDVASLNDCRNAVSDYNKKYHDPDKLRVTDVILPSGETKTPLIVVRRFKNKDDALKYITGIEKNAKDFIPSKFTYEIYAISQTNYGKLFATVKSVEVYKTFYDANYK